MKKQATVFGIAAPHVIGPPTQFNPLQELVGYAVQTAGRDGVLAFNDCTSVEAASAENLIISIPCNLVGPGSTLNLPITMGLVVSEVPSGMVLDVMYSFFVVGRHG